jgi:hypothetical protein
MAVPDGVAAASVRACPHAMHTDRAAARHRQPRDADRRVRRPRARLPTQSHATARCCVETVPGCSRVRSRRAYARPLWRVLAGPSPRAISVATAATTVSGWPRMASGCARHRCRTPDHAPLACAAGILANVEHAASVGLPEHLSARASSHLELAQALIVKLVLHPTRRIHEGVPR